MVGITLREKALQQQLVGLLPRLRRFARGLAGDRDKADDLVQETCERALTRLAQFQEGTRFDSWLYRIIYTRWIDAFRREKIRSAGLIRLAGEEDKPTGPIDPSSAHLATAMDIHDALKIIPEEHRAAIILVSVEGYSYKEAADVLNVPIGTVASRVARARTILNRLLSRGHSESEAAVTG